MDSHGPATPAATTYLLRRRPPRGAGPDGTVVFTLEDVGTPPGEDPRATARVVIEGAAASVRSLAVTSDDPDQRSRLLREVLDALRSDGCVTVTVESPGSDWLPPLNRLGPIPAQGGERALEGRPFRIAL
jgi:hypothetical protein